MPESTRPARERIIAREVHKLELRKALERSRRTGADQDLPVKDRVLWPSGPDAPR
jgi:hypothetical protein